MVTRVGTKLATLGCCVLLFLGSQVERANTPDLVSELMAYSNRNLSPPSTQFRTISPERRSIAAYLDSFREFLSIPMNLPSRFISWSDNVKTVIDMPIIQKNCLTTAVYFESRSESELGQLAVAMVVLNRAETSNTSLCGVVYKGANHFNACQFSFACDGKTDTVDDARAWKTSIAISDMAIAGGLRALGESMQVLTIATNYHADYVNPKWSKSLTRLAKIGRHIFYSNSPVVVTAGGRKNYI